MHVLRRRKSYGAKTTQIRWLSNDSRFVFGPKFNHNHNYWVDQKEIFRSSAISMMQTRCFSSTVSCKFCIVVGITDIHNDFTTFTIWFVLKLFTITKKGFTNLKTLVKMVKLEHFIYFFRLSGDLCCQSTTILNLTSILLSQWNSCFILQIMYILSILCLPTYDKYGFYKYFWLTTHQVVFCDPSMDSD